MVEGGMKCIKYLLFAFNLVFFITGLALIIAGAVIETQFKDYLTFFEGSSFSSAAVVLIVVGCIIFIIGFFGCCGAIKENYCMVMTFAVLLAVIFIAEIGVGIAGFVMRKQVEEKMGSQMLKTMKQYNATDAGGVRHTWDKMQQQFKCCGVNGYKDWTNQTTMANPPESCCKKPTAKCSENVADIYTDGCIDGFKNWVEHNVYILAGVGVGLAFVQVIGMIFACCLARAIKGEYEVV